ncbi:MAG: Nif3-like dinuclear metal center hexameric protein [Chitinophagaceae bacterium]|nr:MAG: Nif3-like dinuclear metal center hexameric protein [Chitinophagaceae bacterium]
MQIKEVIQFLEKIAPTAYQEDYDNAGLIVGDSQWNCTGILCCLDSTEDIINEAIQKKCNLIVAHHPIIFKGLKKLNGKNYIERTLIKAIKNDIAIYAIHTNLDNVYHGVNKKIADKLGLKQLQILQPKPQQLKKIQYFVPTTHAEVVADALFKAGAGKIGNYSDCGFSTQGIGTFMPNEHAKPFLGAINQKEIVAETKTEMVFPTFLEHQIIEVLKTSHPYEEVAFDIIPLCNTNSYIGSGMVGFLDKPLKTTEFLLQMKKIFGLKIIKHTAITKDYIQKVAICGGAGIFLLKNAINSNSDIYISSDIKYHEFFDTDGKIILADIGHFESEQFTIELLTDYLAEKFLNFAVLKSEVITNPVQYF